MEKMGIEREIQIDELISDLKDKWKKNPDMRFGQFVVNIIQSSEPCPDVFYIQDERFYEKLKKY